MKYYHRVRDPVWVVAVQLLSNNEKITSYYTISLFSGHNYTLFVVIFARHTGGGGLVMADE